MNTTTDTQNRNITDEPTENAPTYAEVTLDAERYTREWNRKNPRQARRAYVGPFVDDQTPDGCFGAVVFNMGGIQTYWFRGEEGDTNARVVGRIQSFENGRPAVMYRGGGILGGEYVGTL